MTNDDDDDIIDDDLNYAKTLQDEYTVQFNGKDDDDLLYAKMLQEEFDRELIEHEKSLSTSTSTSSPAPLSSLQKLPSKMEDWICSNCSTVNRIPHDKFRCKTEPSICLTINPSILNWIRRQRLVHNFWVKSDVQNSFSKNIRSFRNMGSIINGDFNQTSGLVAFWGPEICPSPIPLAGETIAILDDDDLFPKIVKSHESKKIYTLASIKENIIDVNHMQNNVNVYNYSKDTALPPVVVFRNIDKTGGALLARVFEQVYSADVLSATSIKVHCGAITSGSLWGNNHHHYHHQYQHYHYHHLRCSMHGWFL